MGTILKMAYGSTPYGRKIWNLAGLALISASHYSTLAVNNVNSRYGSGQTRVVGVVLTTSSG